MYQTNTLLIILLALAGAFPCLAQDKNPFQLPGDITVDQTTAILQAAEKLARSRNIPVNIAIVDAGANLKAFLRMDGSYLGSIDVAIKKAKTARYFNIPTGELGKITQPGGAIYQIELSNDGLITFPGGVPIKDQQGVIIGAIGISGGSIEEDHQIAMEAAGSIL
ncbi:GlcG/HbpS family heme-binding protein [Flavilitoribacter nigricans]|uniref:PduO protein n=1 Tax=Flavilitoribacter nigricans (strain ATCC 23147 / DSM 23189 / NBRC 102662 / NCIMB 1420 / SS-2) TaxID=1122177 RepID=A0A2D0N2Y7_FLAN2|nr:heme-binding protein [Flavilitoribacter nigricans]PHN02746.1 PduO protein [Flavilitoribacter nigricans DSM 23189 = NBRC 102662]